MLGRVRGMAIFSLSWDFHENFIRVARYFYDNYVHDNPIMMMMWCWWLMMGVPFVSTYIPTKWEIPLYIIYHHWAPGGGYTRPPLYREPSRPWVPLLFSSSFSFAFLLFFPFPSLLFCSFPFPFVFLSLPFTFPFPIPGLGSDVISQKQISLSFFFRKKNKKSLRKENTTFTTPSS